MMCTWDDSSMRKNQNQEARELAPQLKSFQRTKVWFLVLITIWIAGNRKLAFGFCRHQHACSVHTYMYAKHIH